MRNSWRITSPRPSWWCVKWWHPHVCVVSFTCEAKLLVEQLLFVWPQLVRRAACWIGCRGKMENRLSPTGDAKLDQAVRQWLLYDKVSWQLVSQLAPDLWREPNTNRKRHCIMYHIGTTEWRVTVNQSIVAFGVVKWGFIYLFIHSISVLMFYIIGMQLLTYSKQLRIWRQYTSVPILIQ